MEYTFQRLTPEHVGDLQRLYKRVIGKKISTEQIRKKYDTSYLGKSWYGYFAFHNQEPVAFFGVIPVVLNYNGAKELSAQIVDAMTDTPHGRKGLYTQLAFKTFELLQSDGFSSIWGFPNQISEVIVLNKWGFLIDQRVKGYVLNAPERFSGKLIRKFYPRLAADRKRRLLEPFRYNGKFSGLMARFSDTVSIERADEYMNYKSAGGNFIIRMNDVLFWVKPNNGLLIGDVEADSPEKLKSAITELWEFQKRYKMGPLVFQSIPGTMLTDVLEDLADHTFDSWGVCYKNFSSGFPLERLFVTLGDIDTF